MYARTMLSKSVSACHAERGSELRREVRRPRRDDPVDRRIELPLARGRRRRRRPRGAARRPCPRPATRMPGTLTERVCANADAGASWPTMMFAMTARGEVTHIRVVARHGADRVDARQRLADDAARERRRGLVRLAGPHGDRRQAQAAPVDEALARHVVDQQLADRLLRAVGRLRRERRVVGDRDRAAGRRRPRASSRTRISAARRAGGSARAAGASRRG